MLTQSDRYIYAGRLLNYLERYQDAVALFSEGIEQDPTDARLFRHRGHRYITVRDFPAAVADLRRAAELVKGQPDEHEYFQPETQEDILHILLGREERVRPQHLPVNAETIEQNKGRYKSTLHASIYYHLAIAHYLQAQFEEALDAFREADAVSVDDDMRVANADWIYMTLRRLGREAEAADVIAPFDVDSVQVNPNEDFYLQRLRLYKGGLEPEALLGRYADHPLAFATQGYGVGNWYLYSGQRDKAEQVFRQVIDQGGRGAFGYLAAEADLARL